MTGGNMSSTRFIIGGALLAAVLAGTIPLFFMDYNKASSGTAVASVSKTSSEVSDNSILGTFNGKPLKYADLSTQEKLSVFDAQNQFYNSLESVLAKRYFEDQVKEYMTAQKLTDFKAAQQTFLKEKVLVTDEQVNAFIKQNANNPQLKGKEPAQQASLVKPYLVQQATNVYFKSMLASASESGTIKVTSVDKPKRPVVKMDVAGLPFQGPENAKVTIVEFADYECPYCSRILPTIKEVMQKYDGQVKFVFNNFPLSFHKQAMPAALAATCAGKQGKYWEMHDAIFDNQSQLSASLYPKLAKDLKLDSKEFTECTKSAETKNKIEEEVAYGSSVGVQGTPSFYINGVQLSNGSSVEDFAEVIDPLLKKK